MKLTFFSLSNPNLSELSLREIKEIVNVEGELNQRAITFSLSEPGNVITLFQRNQSLQNLSLFLQKLDDFSKLEIDTKLINNLFGAGEKELKFKLEIEGVKGNENRIELGKTIYQPLIEQFKEKIGIELSVDFKNPDLVFQVYYTGLEEPSKDYLFGLRLNKEDFDSRSFRVFAHQASFKGDFGYFLLRKLGLEKNDQLLCMFAKDATIPIEAALFQNELNVRKIKSEDHLSKIPILTKIVGSISNTESSNEKKVVSAFEEKAGNVRSARNNAKIAKVSDYLNLVIASLDDLELKFQEQEFDKAIVHLTTKDEDRLNEIYYQLNYVLKGGAKVLFISRPSFELVVSDKFKELFNEEVHRGGSSYQVVCLEKK
ncbi:MAG: hypothetical protein ABIG93_01930 [archaeon]|nr:hypothetical protein [Nanoarchaeota archaeon]